MNFDEARRGYMKRTMTVALVMALFGLMACDKSDNAASSTTTSAAGNGGGGGGSIGVKECDDYIAKWSACYKDPTTRAAVQPSFDQVKQQWATMAKDPAQKAGLQTACKAMVDNFPSAACH
jgi:hypothetical protein